MASKRSELTSIGGGTASSKTASKLKTKASESKLKKKKGKSFMKQTTLKEYLQEKSLTEEFYLTKNKNIYFHWANWDKTCEFQKEYIFADVTNEMKLKNLNDELFELKKTTVWLKNKGTSIKTTLYDIYESYMDNRLRATWFEREDLLMSTLNEAGPFTKLAHMRWFNKNTYASFMYRKILTSKVPHRNFRLGLNIPVPCLFDGSPLNKTELVLHQASENGVIFKVMGKNNLSKINASSQMVLELDLTPFIDTFKDNCQETKDLFSDYIFKAGLGKNKKTINLDSSVMEQYNNDRSSKACSGFEFYFFVSYDDLFYQSSHKELKPIMKKFVSKFEKSLLKEVA